MMAVSASVRLGAGQLIEGTKTFGLQGFRKRLAPKQPKSAFTNSRSGRSRESAPGEKIRGAARSG